MTELSLAASDVDAIRKELLGAPTEKCAIIYATQYARADGTLRLLGREVQFPAAADYSRSELLRAELRPDFVARITKRAQLGSSTLVFVHSHPGSLPPEFSAIDLDGERRLAEFLMLRHPGLAHATLVISKGGMRARLLGDPKDVRIVSVGIHRQVHFEPTDTSATVAEVYDRQIRFFGAVGQRALQALRIGIVGLGGTGSIVLQQLAHLGVHDFILIDPDIVEDTNLNRVVNATRADLGAPKVYVAERHVRSVSPAACVVAIRGDITLNVIAHELSNADVIFGCTDSHGSRAVLQQIAYQYLIPCIDMGVVIGTAGGEVTHILGRSQLLAPGLPCFICSNLLDSNEVRRDMMTSFERRADPYVLGDREPAPSVISLNGTIASLSVTMLLAVVTGAPMNGRHLLYDGVKASLRKIAAEPQRGCFICSRSGAFARGNSWPIFGRENNNGD
jgi:molybdopterin/thiamine biosynthesis adenylyltransferase